MEELEYEPKFKFLYRNRVWLYLIIASFLSKAFDSMTTV